MLLLGHPTKLAHLAEHCREICVNHDSGLNKPIISLLAIGLSSGLLVSAFGGSSNR